MPAMAWLPFFQSSIQCTRPSFSTVSRLCAHPLTYSVLFLAVGIGNLSVNSSMGGIADRFGVGGSLRFCGILLLLVAMVTSVVGFKGSGGRRDRHAA